MIRPVEFVVCAALCAAVIWGPLWVAYAMAGVGAWAVAERLGR